MLGTQKVASTRAILDVNHLCITTDTGDCYHVTKPCCLKVSIGGQTKGAHMPTSEAAPSSW